MKEASKSALISAFIYPGVGHFYLTKWISGGLLVSVASWALFIVIGNIMARAMAITDKIISGQIGPDIAVIRQQILLPQSEAVAQQLSTASTALLINWIIGIIDSYRLGRAKDIQEQSHGKLNKDGGNNTTQ
jgi:hypothetical protein